MFILHTPPEGLGCRSGLLSSPHFPFPSLLTYLINLPFEVYHSAALHATMSLLITASSAVPAIMLPHHIPRRLSLLITILLSSSPLNLYRAYNTSLSDTPDLPP